MTANMKPADELLQVRERIKEMKAREKKLADAIKAGDESMEGDFALCTYSVRSTKRFDRKAAEAELGDLSRFDVVGQSEVLKVEAIAQYAD